MAPIDRPVLYVEDDENDAFLLGRAFKTVGIANPLLVIRDGQSAINYLDHAGVDSGREQTPAPCLVLLDIKMPDISGLDVLTWIRTQSRNPTMPVVMLTSSGDEVDLRRAYVIGVNGYLIKSANPEELRGMANAIKEYWLNQNCAPRLASR